MNQSLVRCGNCGTAWLYERAREVHAASDQPGPICPVCHLAARLDETEAVRIESIAELEEQLGALMRSARAGGLPVDAIVHALRDELTFAAEIGHAGRRFTVQLIDLGPEEGELLLRPLRDPRDTLAKRGGA